MSTKINNGQTAETNASQQNGRRGPQPTIIGDACRLSGDLHLEGDAVILGSIDGHVTVTGTLRVGTEANVKGSVKAGTLALEGTVDGDVVCSESLVLASSSTLIGNIFANSFSAEEGATCRGHVIIGPNANAAAEKYAAQHGGEEKAEEATGGAAARSAVVGLIRRKSDVLNGAA